MKRAIICSGLTFEWCSAIGSFQRRFNAGPFLTGFIRCGFKGASGSTVCIIAVTFRGGRAFGMCFIFFKRGESLFSRRIFSHLLLFKNWEMADQPLLASCPQAASISFPRLRRRRAFTRFLPRYSMKASATSSSGFWKRALEMGLYSIMFTRSAGTCR